MQLAQLRDSFINKHALCPVCKASVYYFENSFGSRVYFDDIGRPWPKHPCTDIQKSRTETESRTSAFSQTFSENQLTLLFNAARLRFRPYDENVREIFIVIAAKWLDARINVKARSISKPARKGVFERFSISAQTSIVKPNATFAIDGGKAIFIDPNSLELMHFPCQRFK